MSQTPSAAQPALDLEGGHRSGGGLPEDPDRVLVGEAELGQAGLEVDDAGAVVPEAQRQRGSPRHFGSDVRHRRMIRGDPPAESGPSAPIYRCGSMSASSAVLLLAPTMRVWASPSLKRMSVGMLITSKRRAVLTLSSTFSLTTRRRAFVFGGDLVEDRRDHRQGPHHSAQKSTRTGVAECVTSSSKVMSVTASSIDTYSSLILWPPPAWRQPLVPTSLRPRDIPDDQSCRASAR